MIVQPYLFLEGKCEEALNFYTKVLDAEVMMKMRYAESPDKSSCGHIQEDKIMHSEMKIGDSVIMLSDGMAEGNPKFEGFGLSINPATVEEAETRFAALAEGGKVIMPLEKTFWAKTFGMVADKFGITWMINVAP